MNSCICNIGECVLCEARLLVGMSSSQVCNIQGKVSHHEYPPRGILFQEGESNTRIYFMRSGQVKLTSALADGRIQILRLAVCGHLLGFEAITEDVYPYTAQAITEVEACAIQRKDLLRMLETNPSVSIDMMRLLNEELEESLSLIRDLGLKTGTEKVASFILSLVPTRGPMPEKMPIPLSRLEIAEMLGLTQETVSRVFSEFKHTGLIDAPRGSIKILQHQRLQDIAEGKRLRTAAIERIR